MDKNIDIALFEVATQCFGVPCAQVVQALVQPADVTRVPRTQGALYGVFLHRGQMVPVIDLAHWIGRADSGPRHSTGQASDMALLVLRANDKMLAIRVDAVKGLLRTTQAAVRTICHDTEAAELFHSVVEGKNGGPPLALLDPLRLAVQAQIWSDAVGQVSASVSNVQTQVDNDGGQKQTPVCAVLRVGGQQLALPADAVGEVTPHLPVQHMAGIGGGFLGMTRWRGNDVPVVNLGQMLGLPASDPQRPSWLVVLSLATRQLAFYVQELVMVGALPAAALQAEVELTGALKAVASGSLVAPGGERIYLLDAQKLMDAVPLSQSIARAKAGQTHNASPTLLIQNQSAARAGSWIVFESAQLWAAPMLQLREIIRPDDSLRQALRAQQALPGALEWRGQSVPLVDMRLAQGQGASQDSTELRIMVLQSERGLRAVLVARVVELIPGHIGSRFSFKLGGSEVDSVSVGTGAGQISYRVFDFNRDDGLAKRVDGAGAALADRTPIMANGSNQIGPGQR